MKRLLLLALLVMVAFLGVQALALGSTTTSGQQVVSSIHQHAVVSAISDNTASGAVLLSSGSDVVYVTRTGKKYHASGCRSLSRSKIKTTRAKAEKDGYTPCKVCKP